MGFAFTREKYLKTMRNIESVGTHDTFLGILLYIIIQ
jgi:hypothetical protein